jgi:hypothetical protein
MTLTAGLRPRFTWTDKVAVAVGFGLLALVVFAWLLAVITIGGPGAQHILRKWGASGLALDALITTSLWVVLQGIDFAARGLHRLFKRYRGRAVLAQGSSIDGRPFRGTVTAASFNAMLEEPAFGGRSWSGELRADRPESFGAI